MYHVGLEDRLVSGSCSHHPILLERKADERQSVRCPPKIYVLTKDDISRRRTVGGPLGCGQNAVRLLQWGETAACDSAVPTQKKDVDRLRVSTGAELSIFVTQQYRISR